MNGDTDVENKVTLEVLKFTVEALSTRVEKLEIVTAELVAALNRGRGSIWVLFSLGGLVGVVISNWKSLFGSLK